MQEVFRNLYFYPERTTLLNDNYKIFYFESSHK
jgi:hypothetical protein